MKYVQLTFFLYILVHANLSRSIILEIWQNIYRDFNLNINCSLVLIRVFLATPKLSLETGKMFWNPSWESNPQPSQSWTPASRPTMHWATRTHMAERKLRWLHVRTWDIRTAKLASLRVFGIFYMLSGVTESSTCHKWSRSDRINVFFVIDRVV